jgi:ATP phosphoribosyltransferase regulatory subunit HisZ
VENFGAPGPAADVEVIALADQALRGWASPASG